MPGMRTRAARMMTINPFSAPEGTARDREETLFGFLAQNPISYAGDGERADVNALLLQPFVTYQLGNGWFVRSVPQMAFNWETDKELVPVDLGAGRVFKIGRQTVSCFIEPFWNAVNDEPAPKYGITFGLGLLYPNFWGS